MDIMELGKYRSFGLGKAFCTRQLKFEQVSFVFRTQQKNENCAQAQYQNDAGSLRCKPMLVASERECLQTISPLYLCVAIDLVPSLAS